MSLLWTIANALWVIAAIGGIGALVVAGVYFAIRILSKPLSKAVAHYTFVQEKRSLARLLPPDARTDILKEVKNETQLTQLMKSVAEKNGWKKQDVESLPTWLLTGHLVIDANPNVPSEYSKLSKNYG